MLSRILAFLFFASLSVTSWAQRDYQSYDQLTFRLKRLSSQYHKLCTLTSIGKTATGKEVWLLTLGRERAAEKPAVVIAAGVQATQLATTELSVQMAEQMLLAASIQDSVYQLLRNKTFYIFPNLNPDASEQYHEKLRWERTGNAQPRDDDRDGRIFEDPFEDLNRDGIITMVRVQDTLGQYRPSTVDPRIMVQVNPAKGEKGSYRLLSEGIDNDRDGLWNEDAEGGVNFNMNFSYNFPHFEREAGEHPMSERETKAFADFLFSTRNVYSVFVLGPASTLAGGVSFAPPNVSLPAVTAAMALDEKVNQLVSQTYAGHISAKNFPVVNPTPGDVVQWAYFHYGRFSYSTPGWWVPLIPSAEHYPVPEEEMTPSEREDLHFLKWAEENSVTGVFLNWKPIQHPDFPGQKVEIGGFAPYAKHTPPIHLLKSVAREHLRFFYAYAHLMPELKVTSLRAAPTADGNTLVTAEIHNQGSLPTHAKVGDLLPWVSKVTVTLRLEAGQKLVEGNVKATFESLPAGAKVQASWKVKGQGYVVVEASSPTGGKQSKEIALR
ncbi:M14 family metallopeptidase [Rufibacter ruber]|uniref:M14 family metallopeptidase n=1 Tax=Rufibacter ruber TaxID=1783499 RepID=UPI0008348234|nr:M14 family metallopeptidase [Rufibacter ruber]